MKVRRTLLVGTMATTIVIGLFLVCEWWFGAHVDPCALIGQSILGTHGFWTWILGCVVQLAIGIVAAMIYAVIFEYITHHAGVFIGVAIAIFHVTAAGILVGYLQLGANQPIPQVRGAFFWLQGVAAFVTFLIAHLAFGAMIGAWYGPVRHPIPRTRVVRWEDVGAGIE